MKCRPRDNVFFGDVTMSPDGNKAGQKRRRDRVVLVIGACALDRILVVDRFPDPDSKVRTTSFVEAGGGNAANTAVALARLSSAAFVNARNNNDEEDYPPVKVKLMTKIGTDSVGDLVHEDLAKHGVDLTSPLYLRPPNTTTGLTHIIVSEADQSRTCIHTPGSCGTLEPDDLPHRDKDFFDQLLHDVVHVHSDTRHTEVALLIAREAAARNIPLSLDGEKDRGGQAMEDLLDLASVVITNSAQLTSYLDRVDKNVGWRPDEKTPPAFVRATRLCHYYRKRKIYNEIVTTLGKYGAFHMQHVSTRSTPFPDSDGKETSSKGTIHYHAQSQTMEVRTILELDMKDFQAISPSDPKKSNFNLMGELRSSTKKVIQQDVYKIHRVGTLRNAKVIDTTGAGDSFVAGYILSLISQKGHVREDGVNGPTPKRGLLHPSAVSRSNINVDFSVELGLMLGSWVAGKKLGGFGCRDSLPTGLDVNRTLGVDDITVVQCLRNLLTKPKDTPS